MADSPDPILYRTPRSADCAALTDLCLRSKAHWGYSDAFIEACRTELSVTPAQLTEWQGQVAERSGQILGLVQISIEGQSAWLEKLFVDPTAMGQGIGRAFMVWAALAARLDGACRLVIDSDPNAEGFYRSVGARRVGHEKSASIPGRYLPRLHLELG